MINQIASSVSTRWVRKNIISDEYREVYQYGLELMISSFVGIFLISMIGILFFSIIDAIIFIIVFCSVRSQSGGYHADSYLKCNITTLTAFTTSVILSNYIPFSKIIHVTVAIIGFIILLVLSPIENEYKPIEKEDRPKHKGLSIILFEGFVLSSFFIYEIHPEESNMIISTLTLILAFVLIGHIKQKILMKGRKTNEDNL